MLKFISGRKNVNPGQLHAGHKKKLRRLGLIESITIGAARLVVGYKVTKTGHTAMEAYFQQMYEITPKRKPE